MSKVLFARAAFLAMSIAVADTSYAADLYGQQPPAPAQGYGGFSNQSPAANWAGAYLGVTPGYSLGSLTNKVPGVGALKSSINGASIGGYGGVNALIMNNLIVGAEGDLNLSDQHNAQTNGTDFYKASSNWNGSVRGRLGASYDRYMPYVTAGLAFGNNTLNLNGAQDSTTQIGYALGAGIEGFATDRIVVRGEYIYEGFGDQTHNVAGKSINTNISSGLIRIGAGYRF